VCDGTGRDAFPVCTPQRPAVDITNADIRATIKTAPTDAVTDQQIRVVDIGTYNVAVGVLHRAAKAKQTAISHAQVTEVLSHHRRGGTFVTGARWSTQRRHPPTATR